MFVTLSLLVCVVNRDGDVRWMSFADVGERADKTILEMFVRFGSAASESVWRSHEFLVLRGEGCGK